MTHTQLTAQLLDELTHMPCINSHSHLLSESERLAEDVDALVLFEHAYPRADLVAAGMSSGDQDRALAPGLPLAERWRTFEPYWRRIRLTGYSQCIVESFRGLYGQDALTEETVEPISAAIRQQARSGYYAEILRDRCSIAITLINMSDTMTTGDLLAVDRTLFVPLPRPNRFCTVRSRQQILDIERDYGVRIRCLSDLVALIDATCFEWRRLGVAGIKLSHSYHRCMDFEPRVSQEAEAVFGRLLSDDYPGLETPAGRLLEDYLTFETCRAASEVDLAIQFHMGMRAGNNHSMEGCSAAPMVPLFQAFPKARFDLSHSGFPYLREAGVLAKTFANVYLDMDWIQIISPIGSRVALKEWLCMVPCNKILGFGDDLRHVETVYGAVQIARRNVAAVLAELIVEGLVTESGALDIAQALFYDNVAQVYRLNLG